MLLLNFVQLSISNTYDVPHVDALGEDEELSELLIKKSASIATQKRICIFIADKLKAGGIIGSVFTVVISTVGAGCLSLPYGIRSIGLIPGLIVLFFSAYLAYFTLDLLLISVDYLPRNSRISYRSLALHSYGEHLALFIQFVLLVQFYGASVSYIVAYAGLLDLVWSVYFTGSIYPYLAIGIYCIIVIPLSLFRSMSKLRFTSLLGFSCSLYLSISIFLEYLILCDRPNIRSGGDFSTNHLHFSTCVWTPAFYEHVLQMEYLFGIGTSDSYVNVFIGFITAFPLNIFAYVCHPYVLPVYIELRHRSIDRMRTVMSASIGIATVIYLLISVCSFLLFLGATCSNILVNNFNAHIDIIIACIGISLSCILTLPIYSFTFRGSFGQLIWGVKQLSTIRHITVTVLFGALCVIIGVSVTSIGIVFGILGSTTYPLLGSIFPAMFFVKLVPSDKHRTKRKLAIIQAVFVSGVSLASLTFKIYSIFNGQVDQKCAFVQQIQA